MATAQLERRTDHTILHKVTMAAGVYWVTTYPNSTLMDIRNFKGRKVNFGEPAREIVRQAIQASLAKEQTIRFVEVLRLAPGGVVISHASAKMLVDTGFRLSMRGENFIHNKD